MRTVRLATEADAAGILAVYAPYIRNTAVTFETETPSLDAFRCRMASIIGDYPYLVVEEDGSIVGFAYAHRLGERAAYAWNAELSIYFAPGCTSRGWGSVLFWALIDLLALQGVRNAYSLITVPNEASLACNQISLGEDFCFATFTHFNNRRTFVVYIIISDSYPSYHVILRNFIHYIKHKVFNNGTKSSCPGVFL